MNNLKYTSLNNNIRYIKTKVDGIPKILRLSSCNLCPFLIYDNNHRLSRCAKYMMLNNVTSTNIYSFSMVGDRIIPIQEIMIPTWCGLCKNVTYINMDSNMYVRNDCNSYETVSDINRNLVIIFDDSVRYDIKLQQLVSESFVNNINYVRNEQKFLPERTSTYDIKTIPTYRTCSCCGKLTENVDRNKNYGMCDKCWDLYKDDQNIKHFSFINNFRIKRSINWSNEKYKKIKEID